MTRAGLWRRTLQSERLRHGLCWLIHAYIHFVYRTNRWEVDGADGPRRLSRDGRGFILAFWHGRLLMIPMAWQRLAPMSMLISAHRDGRIIAGAVTYFGVGSIAGSTRHGGGAALRAMVRRLRAGECVGITPDGPAGPACSASAGIVNVARLSGAPIVPISFATSRRRILPSWDRFQLALPFGRGVFLWGEPIAVAADLDERGIEAARRDIEARMVALDRAADQRVGHRPRTSGWALATYRHLARLATPLAPGLLRHRVGRGKEDPARAGERRGFASVPRPPGPLLWVHAASVGEASAMLGLVERILAERPQIEALVTTGTLASARLLSARVPARARHQFAPLDLPGAVARFLDHWQPDLALWAESELWPNLVLATAQRSIPAVLVNARMSARSWRRWRRWPGLIAPVLGAFRLCLAQDEGQAWRFRSLGAPAVESVGDLKMAAAPLPCAAAELALLRRLVADRPLWLAASTHPGEEDIAADVHRALALRYPGLLTILAPRHPARGDAVAAMLASRGLAVARRSRGETPNAAAEVFLVDTIGELGLLYRLSKIAFIGGSLAPHGGHNPFEAARLGCAVLIGPDTSNCAAMAETLVAAGAAAMVTHETLAEAVGVLLDDPDLCARRGAAGTRVAAAGGAVLDAVLGRLAPWLDGIAPAVRQREPSRVPA